MSASLTWPLSSPTVSGRGEGPIRRLGLIAATLFALLFAAVLPARAADLKFPPLTGRVVDDAHVLSDAQKAALTDKLKGLEDRTSRQLVVVTLPSLQGDDIDDYGYRLGRAWAIGQKGQNNGTLFIVAPSEHKVRVEVGYGMEGVLTDAVTSVILQGQVLPRFKAGDVPGGIDAGTDALIQQMGADPSEAEQKAAQAKAQQEAAASDERGYHYVHRRGNPLSAIFTVLFIVFVFGGVFGRRRGGFGGLLPLLFLGSLGGGGRDDDWGGGGGGSGGGDGGGFSGGGGSFGGGGSSGSW